MNDGELRRRYGAVWALMESTPGRPTLPMAGPVELASAPGLLREMWIRFRPLAYMLEVSCLRKHRSIDPCMGRWHTLPCAVQVIRLTGCIVLLERTMVSMATVAEMSVALFWPPSATLLADHVTVERCNVAGSREAADPGDPVRAVRFIRG